MDRLAWTSLAEELVNIRFAFRLTHNRFTSSWYSSNSFVWNLSQVPKVLLAGCVWLVLLLFHRSPPTQSLYISSQKLSTTQRYPRMQNEYFLLKLNLKEWLPLVCIFFCFQNQKIHTHTPAWPLSSSPNVGFPKKGKQINVFFFCILGYSHFFGIW